MTSASEVSLLIAATNPSLNNGESIVNTLALQAALRGGATLESLSQELHLAINRHPSKPLVNFKYDQIDSPKLHPIVRECRGIVLEEGTWNLVAKAFNRFFNVGEDAEDFAKFDWSDFCCTSKEDGSLILLYHYDGEWRVNTSGSFGFGEVQGYSMTWKDLFWSTSKIPPERLHGLEGHTLVFELCTPYNKVVRRYASPRVYLLSAFRCEKDGWEEYKSEEVRSLYGLFGRLQGCNVLLPDHYTFPSKDDITNFLISKEDVDKTFEGVILRDSTNRRYKWKTKTYVAFHQLKDNGNILLPKRVVPIVLSGEIDEVVATLPETKTAMFEARDILDAAYKGLIALWHKAKDAGTQKDYAMMVKDHPLAALLFNMRKHHPGGTEENLRLLWRKADELLVNKLFDGKSFTFDIPSFDEEVFPAKF